MSGENNSNGKEHGMAIMARIEGTKMHIVADIENPPVPSASGKTLVVCTTRGNHKTAAMIDGKPVTIGLNAYIPK
jgi:hypothetical protein